MNEQLNDVILKSNCIV